ncbi:hypothetical protein [Hymenobacter psychrotolerans]|uniref:Lipoprotein n=1 Tax=Hymenobacter psychrotolerans DSM 18569 TaxID=1121959 RepID=A0A1M7B124_9BACT|nr:hypothetical protein [Hymenobacter psychrotolerans]SHL48587.1 hypothetical protein SAMN02746009_02825 [Hymenobacter psychrotolerans DSM 18569]
MRKSLLVAASLALCVSFTGCEDQRQEVQPIVGIATTANYENPRPKFDGNDCVEKGGDCLPPVIINPPQRGTAANFDNIMSDASAVGKYFNGADWQPMFPQLAEAGNADVLKALQSGTCYFIKYYSKDSGKSFYIGGQQEVGPNNHSVVIPIINR